MLATLRVRDLVLIEDVELEFLSGLNVLTGETGAGKSILLDALGLATGARAGARSSVRPGCSQASAAAIFDLPPKHVSRKLIEESGLPSLDEAFLRRTIAADGRTRAFVNDEPVGVGLLRDIGALLVEIHGQTDDRGLFDPATHRRLLDAFGGYEELVIEVAERFRSLQSTRDRLGGLHQSAQKAAQELEFLRHTAEELSELAPATGEEERLASERALLMDASRITEDFNAAIECLGGDQGAETLLSAALKRLSRQSSETRVIGASAARALEQAIALVEEARQELQRVFSRLEVDAGELDRKEERLFALRAAARKYGVPADALAGVLQEATRKLEIAGGNASVLLGAEKEFAAAELRYRTAAQELSERRKEAATDLERAVADELGPLKLGHARFRVLLEELPEADAAASGLERVIFEVSTVEGAAFGALSKIASGGELARFSLALKVALSEASPPASLVFDEVDRGVGGAVADAVGERLQRLSRSTQVLLVTHAPQVAARAERHFRIVRKRDRTEVQLLAEADRVEEIARMLSGAVVTEEARAAARRLLAEAQTPLKKLRKRA
ncbi:MAG: DNA repair protein RecN [Alphaproteobacteria bacterium]|nr:DNA repair protein RecN [Alphaproteobacteria bacterium]MBV9061905.1 DNA repair protein RecN [Alphaproteobacteria bacterium]